MSRPSWDEYFSAMVQLASLRSTCLRRQVGAVIVRDNHVLASGYNGAPRGVSHCEVCLRTRLNIPSGEKLDICRAAHAEQNVICQAAHEGIKIQNSTLYVSVSPCFTCAKMIINSGISVVKYIDGYPDELGKQILDDAGIRLIQINASRWKDVLIL